MANHEQPALPVIDFQRISSPNAATSAAEKGKLFQAFNDVGFIYLTGHTITDSTMQTLFGHVEKLFAKSDEEKIELEGGEKTHFHGWFSPKRTAKNPERSDQKEAFGLGDDNDPTRPNIWPKDWPEFRTDVSAFFEQCHIVHIELLTVLAEQVGLDKTALLPYVSGKDHYSALLYYPETTAESFKDRVRAAPHTDFGTLTLLFNDQAGGLQVRARDGHWVDAPPMPGHAIVNVADLLSRWFNNTLKSTEHRVVEPPTSSSSSSDDTAAVIPARYSIAWFGHPDRDALVKPLDQCCTADNPRKFDAVYAGKHVKERFAQLHKDGYNAEVWTDDMQRKKEAAAVIAMHVGA